MKLLIVLSMVSVALAQVPPIPCELKNRNPNKNGRESANIWAFSLVARGDNLCTGTASPRIYVLISDAAWARHLRQDVAKPIYDLDPDISLVREYIIRELTFNFPRVDRTNPLLTFEGIQVLNLNNKVGIFQQNAAGVILLNGIALVEQERLSDGSIVFIAQEFLFDIEELLRLVGNAVFDPSSKLVSSRRLGQIISRGLFNSAAKPSAIALNSICTSLFVTSIIQALFRF